MGYGHLRHPRPRHHLSQHPPMPAQVSGSRPWRGVALVKPDELFLVKICNFGPDQAIVRKNSILGSAAPFQGPMLAAITEKKATQDTPTGEDILLSDDPVENVNLS